MSNETPQSIDQDRLILLHYTDADPGSFVASISTLKQESSGSSYPQLSIHITGEAQIELFKRLIVQRAFNCIWEDLPDSYREFADMVIHGKKQPSNRDISERDRAGVEETRRAIQEQKDRAKEAQKASEDPKDVHLPEEEVARIRDKFGSFKPIEVPQPEVTLSPGSLPSTQEVFGLGRADESNVTEVQDIESREISSSNEEEPTEKVTVGSIYVYNRTGGTARVLNVGRNEAGEIAVEFEVDVMGRKKSYQQVQSEFLKNFHQ